MSAYLLAIDQGTTSSRAFMIDAQTLTVCGSAQSEFPQQFPRPGWVEHDPDAIWQSVCAVIRDAIAAAKISASDIVGIGITNQRETTVLWERAAGRAIAPAIVWQDRRTAPQCAELKQSGAETLVRERTGLVCDPYFSGTKIAWLLDHVAGARAAAEAGTLAFGTIDSFLVWRLTQGAAHVTDASNASRTLLMGLATCAWDDELCALFRVPRAVLPTIVASAGNYGTTRGVPGLPDGIPITGMAGDQQAALFGQACFAPGDAKCTYGTGSFLLMNTGVQPIASQSGLLTTVAWQIGDRVTYALEGASFIAGAAVQWLRDGLGVIAHAADIEALAASVPDSDGVMFVPALAGLGAPHWNPDARGVICGLTRGTTRAHLARATLDGIALQQCDLLRAMEAESGIRLRSLKVDGGAASNNLLMQIQADALGVPLVRPQMPETTVLGAACLAGLGAGVWRDTAAVAAAWRAEREFTPKLDDAARARLYTAWQRAVRKCADE